jgi:hypothetical protein
MMDQRQSQAAANRECDCRRGETTEAKSRLQRATRMATCAGGVAVAVVATVLAVYVVKLRGYPFPRTPEAFAAFGDYFGGVLSAVLALLGLAAILYTVVLQTEALELSHRALQLSKLEFGASATSMRKQVELLTRQRVEEQMFRLIDLHRDVVGRLVIEWDVQRYTGGAVFEALVSLVAEESECLDEEGFEGGCDERTLQAFRTVVQRYRAAVETYLRSLLMVVGALRVHGAAGVDTAADVQNLATLLRSQVGGVERLFLGLAVACGEVGGEVGARIGGVSLLDGGFDNPLVSKEMEAAIRMRCD